MRIRRIVARARRQLEEEQLPHGELSLGVMIEVGGLAEGAAGNRAMVARNIDGRSVEIPVRINDLLNKGKISANIDMRPGDVLIIPESRF